ncbi:MAG: lysylphosphatidylglycerol synthase transmembrane domain-containing protein, partial [Pseudomonadota bacterium]
MTDTPSSSESSGRARRIPLKSIAKAALGIGLLAALLLWQDNGRQLVDILLGFQVEYLVALLVLQVLLNGISSIKWRVFLRDRSVDVSLWTLFRLYLIGRFFNNFLPSMMGGDVTRSYLLGRKIKSQAASAASVTMERATGLVGLTILAVVFVAVNPSAFVHPIVIVTIIGAVVVCLGATVIFSSEQLGSSIESYLGAKTNKLSRKILRLVEEIGHYRGRQRVLFWALVYSCVFQFLAGMNVYFASLSVGFAPDLLDVLVVTPAILILAMIPVSPNNVGWWEWCFSVLLINAGA